MFVVVLRKHTRSKKMLRTSVNIASSLYKGKKKTE